MIRSGRRREPPVQADTKSDAFKTMIESESKISRSVDPKAPSAPSPADDHVHDHACSSGGCQGDPFGHHHPPAPDESGSRLLLTLFLNLVIPVVQVIGGLQARSVALISDAAHNFSDFTAVLVAYVANRISKRGASTRNTFGYRRTEVLAAVINVGLLLGASVYILYEALQRFLHPESVSGGLVVIVAGIGIVGNGISAILLHRDSKHSLNIRGAFLHMLGDFATSVVVAINGLVLLYKPWYWLDPLLSLLIVAFILRNCWSILKEATCILMNATPNGLDIRAIREYLERIPGVLNAHYLHAWNVCTSSVAFSCHLVVPDQKLSAVEEISKTVRGGLWQRFKIDHPLLQFETSPCGQGGLFCEASCIGAAGTSTGEKTVDERTGGGGTAFGGSGLRRKATIVLRVVLGVIMLLACYDKILHPAAFAKIIFNYQILPGVLVNPVAIVLPWLELALGICLIFGFWLPGATLITNGLFTVFLAALIANLIRGINIHCGCFSTTATGDASTSLTVLRDVFFTAMSVALLVFVFKRPKARSTSTPR